ncbi:LOW QUALITY PROTEIN: dTDP-4-dehydrorhamnose 3,5-epimerase [Bacillus sp. JCM 19046]|uniref:dTDP-4-dehydrorhamnose 3,5-epimerase n=1 Tax=Shouchella xiaoxiensis TaxID=766895 RepID=A0ABS2SWS0_9BACI|nr:dTDP-4-dehydrorhamnose 3,5-epimerase [Shouchella xiaoxiensis]MBM7839987.1 dTDP-4-dehydrorhamnose 3,5-epimerase [Shouchella xiaoxiensis]GAF12652.1 dTDP-4-dehydrorhamnose 3,5-epimerase [Bacillus sp. JCM 19045]GAF17785.1 LOW QUALITY PROTEIN: dTDP-4-dehydrorhamnose 3,5-epimerase [Bacillus sp. JCM 19046]
MEIKKTKLAGVVILQPRIYGDDRGYFVETFNQEQFERVGVDSKFIQDNQSLSKQAGTIRGLHYQLAPDAQTKIVRCAAGAIYDVAVDIRKDSPTYKEWVGVILSAENQTQLVVPKGFAHGFCTLVPDTIVAYKVDNAYSPKNDRGIRWNDPELAIDWPAYAPTLSKKDRVHPLFHQAEMNF